MVRISPDHAAKRERFTEDLLAIMTVEERVGQLVVAVAPDPEDEAGRLDIRSRLGRGLLGGLVGPSSAECLAALQQFAIEESRLGIPLLRAEMLGQGEAVTMPSAFALAASWSPEIVEQVARVIAAEARSCGTNWLLGPVVGRSTSHDDEHLSASWGSSSLLIRCLASAMVRGIQYGEEDAVGVMACLRLDDPSWADRRDAQKFAEKLRIAAGILRETPPGSIALTPITRPRCDIGLGSEGTAFSISRPGGFEGIDLAAWGEIARASGQEPDETLVTDLSVDGVVAALGDGRVSSRQLDEAVRRVIRAKYDLGLFDMDEPQASPAPLVPFERARAIALDAARSSIVLLRNDPALLPLDIGSGDILVVGRAATDRSLPSGGKGIQGVSLLDGLEAIGLAHKYVPGLALRPDTQEAQTGAMIDADRMAIGMASDAARRAGTVIVTCGELGSRCEGYRTLVETLRAINPNIVLVTMGSNPCDPVILGEKLPCVLHAGSLGSMAGHAIAEVLTGACSPQGRLPLELTESGGPGLSIGHGLSFSDFGIGETHVEPGPDRVVVSTVLHNVGRHEGVETVQVYLRRPKGRGQSRSELVDFQRVSLAAGESRRLVFEIGGSQLGCFEPDGHFTITPGSYVFSIGLSEARAHSTRLAIPPQLAEAMERELSSEPLPVLFGRKRNAG